MNGMDRRRFLGTLGAIAATPALAKAMAGQDDVPRWSSPVIDMHFHGRQTPELNMAHQVGAGITAANMLISAGALAADGTDSRVAAAQARNKAMFPIWFVSTDLSQPDAETRLTAAVKGGAKGFGELKMVVDADGPEMRRVYSLAADLNVPILIHFQDLTADSTSYFNRGFRRFEAILKTYPRTRFIGHANSFWANVSADNADQKTYPTGPIVPGGITDKLLADYPNLFGDLAANSGNNALARSPAFTVEFLKRHQDKLHFGSDCQCVDGRGGSAPARANAPAGRGAAPSADPVAIGTNDLTGKCIARETLALLAKSTSPEIFRKIAWTNAHRLVGLPV